MMTSSVKAKRGSIGVEESTVSRFNKDLGLFQFRSGSTQTADSFINALLESFEFADKMSAKQGDGK